VNFCPGPAKGPRGALSLEKHLMARAKRFRPGADAGDVLIVNGRGADETRIKNLLRRRVSGFPAFDAYLAACRVVVLPEERFTPEAAIAALPNTATRGKTLNLFTADPTAILINPHRTHRVLPGAPPGLGRRGADGRGPAGPRPPGAQGRAGRGRQRLTESAIIPSRIAMRLALIDLPTRCVLMSSTSGPGERPAAYIANGWPCASGRGFFKPDGLAALP
jgi:hypothetical protein